MDKEQRVAAVVALVIAFFIIGVLYYVLAPISN